MRKLAGISLVQVPYRGGGEAIHDLIAGNVQLGSLGTTPLIPYYKAGTLNLLAQSTATRSPALPDVPTFQEAGLKELVLDQWTGVFVPVRHFAGDRRAAQYCGERGARRPQGPEKLSRSARRRRRAALPISTPESRETTPTNSRDW